MCCGPQCWYTPFMPRLKIEKKPSMVFVWTVSSSARTYSSALCRTAHCRGQAGGGLAVLYRHWVIFPKVWHVSRCGAEYAGAGCGPVSHAAGGGGPPPII